MVGSRFRDEQAVFRKVRSRCDQIATLRIIVEQTLEWNTGLYMNFVDNEKPLKFHRSRSALEQLAAPSDPLENRDDDPDYIAMASKQEFCMRVK